MAAEETDMTHLIDDYEDATMPSEPNEMPQVLSENAGFDDTAFAQSAEPANENAAPRLPLATDDAFETSADESFRIAASEKLDDLHGFYAASTDACESIAQAMRTSLEVYVAGLGEFNSKLMEFGRVNAEHNMAFVQNVSGIRSVRDAVDVQTTYMREQYDAAAAQLRELQTLTTEIAEKAAAPFKQQFVRSTQMFRSC
jgi:hypothetical protein